MKWFRTGFVLALSLLMNAQVTPRGPAYAKQAVTLVRTLTILDSDEVNAVSFSPNGKWIAAGVGDGTVRIWNVSDGRLVKKLKVQTRTMQVAFSPDGLLIATADMGPISLLRADDGQVLMRLPAADGKEDFLNGLAFSPDGKFIAAISSQATTLWRASDGKLIRTLARGDFSSSNYSPGGFSVAFSSDGQIIFADGRRIKAWRSSDGRLSGFWGDDHDYSPLAVDPSGQVIAAGYNDIELLASDTGRRVCALRTADMSGNYEALAFSPNGRFLASSNLGDQHTPDQRIRLWDVNRCQLIATIQKFGGSSYRKLAFNPEGTLLAVPGKASPRTIGIRLFRVNSN